MNLYKDSKIMLTITVTRNKGWYGRIRTAKIMADDEEIGQVRSGESVNVQVPAHSKNLYAKMDWGRSTPYPVSNITDGQTIYMNAWFTFNLLRGIGVAPIPIAFEEKPR